MGLTIDCENIDGNTAAVIVPWPDTHGIYHDHSQAIELAKKHGALVIAAADPLALVLLEAPAKWGADMAAGSMQRFGVPMAFGGPHAAYLAVTNALTRLMPGRLVGQSLDAAGRPGYRLALQTREQHIRRDKATSNICTAQALLANMAAAYSVWHGPEGLSSIASQVHDLASRFAAAVKDVGYAIENNTFFDCVTVVAPGKAAELASQAEKTGRFIRVIDNNRVSVNFDEASSEVDAFELAELFGASTLPARRHRQAPCPPLRLLHEPAGLPCPPLGNRNDALPAQARRQGPGARPGHDPARLLHDEAQRRRRNDPGLMAKHRPPAPVRPRQKLQGHPRDDRRA